VWVRAAGCLIHPSHHAKFWHGLLISPGLETKPGVNPKFWPLGVPLIMTLSEKPWRVKNWARVIKIKLLLGLGLPGKILFFGAHPNPGPPGSTQPKEGICTENCAGASNQMLLLGVGLPGKTLFMWGSPQPGAHPTKRGICF